MVSSTDGSPTNTGWKRRASAASFSMCLRYSSSVVAPMQCSLPRASSGLIRLEASIEPSARPAPIRLCSSSMNRMTCPWAASTSFSTAFSRSSNSPRYFDPATNAPRSSAEQLLALQRLRHVAVDDAQRKALDDGGLADAGLADQHGVVLGAARQHLDGAADLLVAPDHRIEFSLARHRCYVAGVFLQSVEVRLGIRAVDRAALADVADRLLQCLGSCPGVAQRTGGRRVGGGDCHQQPVLRDELVAGLGRGLLCGVQDAHEVWRDLRLAGAGALHLWQPTQFRPDRGKGCLRVAASGLDQAGGGTFLVVQQRLQQVLWRDLLVKLADRNGLSGLQEAPRPLGEFLNVHLYVPVRRRPVSSPHPSSGNGNMTLWQLKWASGTL